MLELYLWKQRCYQLNKMDKLESDEIDITNMMPKDIYMALKDTKLLASYPEELLHLISDFSIIHCLHCDKIKDKNAESRWHQSEWDPKDMSCRACFSIWHVCSMCYATDEGSIGWQDHCAMCEQTLCEDCGVNSVFHETGIICPDCIY